MQTRLVFFPLKRPDDEPDVRDLEHMVLYGIEELLDLGERGLYFDSVLQAREVKGARCGAPQPDLGHIPFHVTGSLTLDEARSAVRIRLSVKDITGERRPQHRRVTLARNADPRCGQVAYEMAPLHEVHKRFYGWLAEIAGLPAPRPNSYHAYRLEHPITAVPEAFRELVRGLRVARDIDEKVPHYRRAVELDPCLGRAHRNLGYLFRARGDLESAVEAYEKAAATMIDEAGLGEVYFEMGLSHAGRADYRDSIRCWKRSLEFTPFRREALYNIGLAYEELNNPEMAIEFYSSARGVDGSYLSALEGLFRLHIQEGAYLRAVEVLKDWIKITPHDAGLHRIIGHCYRKEGMNDEALVHLKKAVELDPEGEIGREARRDILDL
ncbi:MAG: tetratricopeptide repeat protein [Planctomycetes bacterium]|nr:tetratricopeptide repeat protein [Planctomycetota bacterium]